MVRVEGFEPSISCSQSRRIKPDFPTLGYLFINGGPYRARTGPPGLQSPCAPNNTYSPLILNLEQETGFEPASTAWKAVSSPRRTPALVRLGGLEPPRLAATDFKSVMATDYITVAYYLVGKERLELSRLAALVPKTSVAAITPLAHYPLATRKLRILSAA